MSQHVRGPSLPSKGPQARTEQNTAVPEQPKHHREKHAPCPLFRPAPDKGASTLSTASDVRGNTLTFLSPPPHKVLLPPASRAPAPAPTRPWRSPAKHPAPRHAFPGLVPPGSRLSCRAFPAGNLAPGHTSHRLPDPLPTRPVPAVPAHGDPRSPRSWPQALGPCPQTAGFYHQRMAFRRLPGPQGPQIALCGHGPPRAWPCP